MAHSKLSGSVESTRVNGLENYGYEHLAGLSASDRFCVACGIRKSDAILQKRLKCPNCKFTLSSSNSVPSFWTICFQCTSIVDCTFKYCRTCGCSNTNFEPARPEREQRLAKAEMKKSLLIEKIERKKRKKEDAQKREEAKREEADEAKRLREDIDGDAICSEGLSTLEDSQNMVTTGELESSKNSGNADGDVQ